VYGHTDTAGFAIYNDVLSRRRAEAVSAALVSMGIPQQLIKLDSLGERRPLVDTGDGVRNDQNRRVEVRIIVQ